MPKRGWRFKVGESPTGVSSKPVYLLFVEYLNDDEMMPVCYFIVCATFYIPIRAA